ncbi:hypothetical protein R6Q57_010193 [Mikania cordata]
MGIAPVSENVALLSAINILASGSRYHQTPSSQSVPFETAFLSSGQEKGDIGLAFTTLKPPFNHNYSIMPNINTSVDDLLMKSDQRFDFTTGSNKPVPLTADPVETDPNISDDSGVCADSLNDTGLRRKNKERSAGRSTECSTSSRKSHFIPKTDFVGRFDEIKIKPNEMFKNFNSTFVKNDDILESVFSLKQVNKAHSTITKEAGSKLNPNCEPFVPTGSLEQTSTSTSSGHGDCDTKPFDPKEFHEKVCCFACGRPGHIAKNCLHRPTEFFYGKNQKVTPKAKPTKRSMRTDQSSKPRVTPKNVPQNPPTAKKAKPVKQNQSGFHKQKPKALRTKSKPPVKPPLKLVDHDSDARPKIIRAKPIKPKGVIKKGPIVPHVPKSIMVWVPISH